MAAIVRFPSWRYHATHAACVVANQDESDALGPEWADSQTAANAYVPAQAPVEVPVLEDGAEDDTKKKPRKGGR